ncbi:MAG: hypothetical protein ACYSTI_10065 [Planctomycetota bacterium]|jgi:hypothetical protein
MTAEILHELLLKKSLEELCQLRGEQYTSKEALIQDIIKNDDGSVAEMVELERSPLAILAGIGK